MKELKSEKIEELLQVLKEKFRFLNKYDYNINEVIGVKGKEKYILYVDKKLIRIYRGKLKSSPLLATYLPIENAIFYNFKIEKSVIEKVDLESFIETKVYDEAGVDDTEDYVIKYKIVDNLKDEKFVMIETVIVPVTFLHNHYKYILEETGYIDYISFPAFAYRALYEEKILQKANDLFIVMLYDKIFLTFYSEGELVYIQTLSNGLNKIYDALKNLKIKDFDLELFKKILTKKGLSINKYSSGELVVFETIKKEMHNILRVLQEQIDSFINIYDIDELDRVFVTSEYGDIEGLEELIQEDLGLETYSFEFYEKYNLDRLPIDPFLFLGMLEAHYAYKNDNQRYNFSLFLRRPTFFYRPSGQLVLFSLIATFIMILYPLYLWISGMSYESKNRVLKQKISSLKKEQVTLKKRLSALSSQEKTLNKEITSYTSEIKRIQNFIESVYKFKFSYMPKSQELVDISYLMNKNSVYAKNISYSNGLYILKVFAYHESDIPNLIKELSDNGFSVDFDEITYKDKKYNSVIRIKE